MYLILSHVGAGARGAPLPDHDSLAPVVHDSRSVLTRSAPAPTLTVRYGDHAEAVADVWLPVAGGAPRPVVVFLHGGFWRAEFDRRHLAPLASELAAAGYPVATPEFRRTGEPSGGWPGTFDDVDAAVRGVPGLVAEAVQARGGATAPAYILAGHSAGGHLALWAAAIRAATTDPAKAGAAGGVAGRPEGGSRWTEVGPAPIAVVALAPVADLQLAHHLDLDQGAVAALLGGGPAAVPQVFAVTDPMALAPIRVPLEIVHGDRDRQVPLELSRRFAARARWAGDDVRLSVLAGIDHFAVIDPQSPAWSEVVAAVGRASRPGPGVDGAAQEG